MKALLPILVLALGAGLAACGSNAAATPIPTVILGPSSPGDGTSPSGAAVSASAEVVPLGT